MKWFAGMSAIAILALATTAHADEVKSGPQPGDKIAPFDVVKCAGATDDGVSVGDKLCYRCKYGAKPMVMVFTRSSDDQVAGLVKKLDKAVSKNSEKELKAFVNIVGENRSEAESCAKQMAKDTSVENVPIVVPEESANGPDNYGINPDAVVTVIVARDGKVVASHGYSSVPDSDDIKQIMHDVHKMIE